MALPKKHSKKIRPSAPIAGHQNGRNEEDAGAGEDAGLVYIVFGLLFLLLIFALILAAFASA